MNVTTNACRLSWFLIEVDENLRSNDVDKYSVIHTMDVNEHDSNEMYLNRRVHFTQHQKSLSGKIILATDDRFYVEMGMIELSRETAIVALKSNANKENNFLIQYASGKCNLVHRIVSDESVILPADPNSNPRELLFRDGEEQQLVTLLYQHKEEDWVQTQLDKLKEQCVHAPCNNTHNVPEAGDNMWLLVQYSCTPKTMIYSIIEQRQTVWQDGNMYPNIVVYLSDGDTIYQAIIIGRSFKRNDLDQLLCSIKTYCQTTEFPLDC